MYNPKITNPIVFRQNVVKRLNKLIRKIGITTNLERGIYNYAIQSAKGKNVIRKWDNPYFATLYLDKLKTIYNNLNVKGIVGNTELIKRLKSGEFKPHELAFMKPHQLYPDK